MINHTQVSFSDFYKAIPQVCAIYDKYPEYVDEHSRWLGRWVKRAERKISETTLASDNLKQETTDKLITKLVSQILVSPYDQAPFVAKTEKRPVLFNEMLFPYWMLEDILKMIGNLNALRLATPHALMIEILEWSKSLEQKVSPAIPNNGFLIPLVGGALVIPNQKPLASHLDSSLLVSIDFSDQPDLTLIKLLAYRDLIKNALREMVLRKRNRGVRKQFKQIVKFGDEQKALAEKEKTQNVQQRTAHAQAVNTQFEEIAQIQESTQDIMKEHFQSLIDQMNATEERMKKMQQECQNKEAQIKALEAAQRNLRP